MDTRPHPPRCTPLHLDDWTRAVRGQHETAQRVKAAASKSSKYNKHQKKVLGAGGRVGRACRRSWRWTWGGCGGATWAETTASSLTSAVRRATPFLMRPSSPRYWRCRCRSLRTCKRHPAPATRCCCAPRCGGNTAHLVPWRHIRCR